MSANGLPRGQVNVYNGGFEAEPVMPNVARVVMTPLVILLCQIASSAVADERDDFFEAKIRPVLVETCFRCHGETKTGGGLRIDARALLMSGGESGPAIVPGKPEESLLIRAIRREADVSAMPPEKDKALRADQIADFATWIQSGAHWPEKTAKFETAKHWAFEPIRDVPLPTTPDDGWVQSSVDRFIRVKQGSMKPAPRADKLTLIRRATFDLIGLPPSPTEIEAFLKDEAPDAFERVVDRLLKSSAYGERWGRHWLDVVRYADTAGETADYPVPLAWRYRNYVIDAFNADKPYDEFLREQIAGDLLAHDGPTDRYAERVTATGYLAISRRFGFDSENYHHLTIQDTIDTLGQSVLGLSLGCARCHDHKFDAVTMRDYYGLYGIFDSSRYSFPGSEQKQKFRAMTPLLPPGESSPQWRAYESRMAALTARLTKQKQPLPAAVFRSLNEMDGDFELQAPASGGSNGVLVPPWLYTGPIAVTAAAQSPFKHVSPQGRVGASIAAGPVLYRIAQALHPRREPTTNATVYVSLDFRVGPPDASQPGEHRLTLGELHGGSAVEVRISSREVALQVDNERHVIAPLPANQWQNLQLKLDLVGRTVSGQIGSPGTITEFAAKPLSMGTSAALEVVALESIGLPEQSRPGIEYDNLAVQTMPFAAVATEPTLPTDTAPGPDIAAITEEVRQLSGIDGDFELQTVDTPPSTPWGPGPNSVVKVSAKSQSPFSHLFPSGDFGLFMPNRGEYDGFGMAVPNIKPDKDGRVFAAFDFRCASQDAGGNGTWRYYLGHGPGNSAAVELFFNGKEFFRRSADAREAIAPLTIGEWYQVQIALNLPAKTYTGTLSSRGETREFSGQLATGWDGTLDYTFIDSYGHIGGVRPALDADNFVISDQSLTAFGTSPVSMGKDDPASKRQKVRELRQQLAMAQQQLDRDKQELETLLNDGPFAMTYGMSEGTPHDVRIQLRGEPDRPGDVVPRGFIKSIGGNPLPKESLGSGRLELAEWLTRPENPLTARVMVNRIWQYHFGRGIVKTPNDFGVRGLPPTHPDLLDHLATQFIRGGWSIKSMHRLIMLSATYQQASARDASHDPLMPMNDLYVGFPRRRLSAEEIRDAILTVSGELDPTPGREHPFPPPMRWGYTQHGPFNAVYDHNRRSVYLMTQRLKRHPFLALFDGPDPNASTADRLGTTVPTQALFFLNDPFVHDKADRWATRLSATVAEESQRIDQAWRSACGRSPTNAERTEAVEFLTTYRAELAAAKSEPIEQRALAAYLRTLIGSNEFLHVD